ncbi:hypothetical protein JAAARDRAFT_56889 [Jaapia argillacea MUCL 33604]|uniref:Amine oxidase n=1 Tax=Jaapia argillacea MUCL 33604 TaxID=933084 RepID=A0A067Q1G6_9AGAM|nr:hypothetical protein JAAARDRAFT_56889 [Jaapia argillacea MUCL 33604]
MPFRPFYVLLLLAAISTSYAIPFPRRSASSSTNASVLILGGGVAGVIAARTLHEQGITNYLIIEARNELGGRLTSHKFGAKDHQYTVEVGANWVQGTETPGGNTNPIWTLANKHNVSTVYSDYFDSMTTYDYTGQMDYLDLFNKSIDAYTMLTDVAGARVARREVDSTSRTGYSLIGSKPQTPQEMAAEYYQFDWEYAQTPEETSWIASSWANNFTFDPSEGGFSDENYLCIDQRGFKTIVQAEASEFLDQHQVLYNATITDIAYSPSGVQVSLADGRVINGQYSIVTFSLGVLQHDDVVFEPTLPDWKVEAIQSMTMATYSKIFFQFPDNFWFDTQFALYADKERGRYPVWQSLDLQGFFEGSGILFVTVTGDFSERIEALPDSQVQLEILSVLRNMFPNVTIPDPIDFYYQRWHSDPLFRGSYSNWPASFFSEHHENLRADIHGRLWFAGEHTSMKWFGFLHGAYFEGLDVATRVADCINGGGCISLQHFNEVKNARSYTVG